MSEQRKISSKKVLRFSIGAALVIIFMIALAAASNRQNNDTIKDIDVTLNEDHDFNFLDKKDIVNLLINSRHIDLKTTTIDKLDLKKMEEVAKTNPWVKAAEVFVDNREVLKVNITQREPIARLFDVNGASYYMDGTLHTMPVSVGYSYPAPVFTNVPVLAKDSLRNGLNAKIAYLSERIGRDSFWHAQITQIEVQPDQTFIMVPLFGDQKIMIGDTSNIDEKLSNLFAFYKNISSKIGWDKYQVLNLRFKGQVVASPSVGWTPPKVTNTDTANFEGPPIAITNTVKPALPVVQQQEKKEEKPISKPVINKDIAKKQVVAKPKVTTTTKPVVQAKKPAVKKEEKSTAKQDKNAKSPKYIYPGKKSGNH